MAGVRFELRLAPDDPVFGFIRPGGIRDSIPALQVWVWVNLMPHVRPGSSDALRAAFPLCILDTGAPLAIIPEYIWSHFHPGVVTPLPFDPAMPLRHRFLTVGGGRYPYQLGELGVQVTDDRRQTMSLRIVAQFTRDGGALTIPMVLVPRGCVFDGRVLRSEPDPAAPFGQAWALEDPRAAIPRFRFRPVAFTFRVWTSRRKNWSKSSTASSRG